MGLINAIPVPTQYGTKTIEVYHDNIVNLGWDFDILIISAFHNKYNPAEGTLLKALADYHNVHLDSLAKEPFLDFRESLSCWVSSEIENTRYKRIVVTESIKTDVLNNQSSENAFSDLFGGLGLLSYKNVSTEKIVMPVLGTGYQKVPVDKVLPILIKHSIKTLNLNPDIKSICFVEIDEDRAKKIDMYLNVHLNRNKEALRDILNDPILIGPFTDLGKNLHALIKDKPSFGKNETVLNLLDKINSKNFKFYQFGILSRKLLEVLLSDMIKVKGKPSLTVNEYANILRELNVAKWIISSIHTIRAMGNSAAHPASKTFIPEKLNKTDINILVLALNRFIQFYINHKSEISQSNLVANEN